MSRINETFHKLRTQGRKALIAYVTAGCPDYDTTIKAVQVLEAAGADIIELGLPFSDPMADGIVIQKAAAIALKNGATTEKALSMAEKIRFTSQIPLVVMTYINTVLQFGIQSFMQRMNRAGIDGLIVPDMPIEEAILLDDSCQQATVDLIPFIAPTTTEPRVVETCKKAQGFIYCISNTGVTGVREVDYSQIGSVIAAVRRQTAVPAAIGFGIGDTVGACKAAQYADGVIVGSVIMRKIMEDGVDKAGEFVASIRQALDRECV